MNCVKFNGTDLAVSPICLGTVKYGTTMPNKYAKEQLSGFLYIGGNFIDTAHVYGDWEPGVLCRSERIIGEWIKETGKRNDIILSTKGAHPDIFNMSSPRVTPKDIEKDLNESLQYLNTDYIDLYFLHRDDPKVTISEIMDCLDNAEKQGKIRYYGCSNWSLPRIKEAQEYAIKNGMKGFVCNQLMWSLADINFKGLKDKSYILMDNGTYKYHEGIRMSVMAYSSNAKGYFTRRFNRATIPERVNTVYNNASNDIIYEKICRIAAESDYTITELSLLYVTMHSFPSVPIASFSNDEQFNEGMRVMTKRVSQDIISELNAIKKFVYY